jgi:hypothetical protein
MHFLHASYFQNNHKALENTSDETSFLSSSIDNLMDIYLISFLRNTGLVVKVFLLENIRVEPPLSCIIYNRIPTFYDNSKHESPERLLPLLYC